MTGMVVAMVFRLIPVLERVALPWPRLRSVAFYGLTFAVILRTAEVAVDVAPAVVGTLVALSGPVAWIAIASAAANLARVVSVRARAV